MYACICDHVCYDVGVGELSRNGLKGGAIPIVLPRIQIESINKLFFFYKKNMMFVK